MKESWRQQSAGEGIAIAMARALDVPPHVRARMNTRIVRVFKVLYGFFTLLLAAAAMATLWAYPLLVAIVLLVLAIAKHYVFPIKYELYWFVAIGSLGALLESLIISGGAWSYANPQFINIPAWLPVIWGLVATVLITGYSGAAGAE